MRNIVTGVLSCLLVVTLASCSFNHNASESPPPAAIASAPGTPGFVFKTSSYTLHPWPNPYAYQAAEYDGPRDTSGVRVTEIDGKTYDHPVAQAMDGLAAIGTYQQSGNAAELTLALAEAQRLVATHIVYADAWWYPYRFDFQLYGDPHDTAVAPWYSAMAQGTALDLFTQLYTVTKDVIWRTAAAKTFQSFLFPYNGDKHVPWVDNVESDGYLWLQEYPVPAPDYTINGMNFAIWGLVDYAQVFADPAAQLLADGALTTMLHAISSVEHPGWISGYSVSHQSPTATYHGIVTGQLASFYTITGDTQFAAWAVRLAGDFPIPEVHGSIALAAGPHVIVTADGLFAVSSVSTVTFSQGVSVSVAQRVKLQGQVGYWYQVTEGLYAGKYVLEDATTYLPGQYNTVNFAPALTVAFPVTTYGVYTSDNTTLTLKTTTQFTEPTEVVVTQRTTIGGVTAWRCGAGPLAGEYLVGPDPEIL